MIMNEPDSTVEARALAAVYRRLLRKVAEVEAQKQFRDESDKEEQKRTEETSE